MKYIQKRELSTEYVLEIRYFLIKKAKKERIPIFDNCINACNFVERLEKKNIIEYSEL